MIYNYDLQQDKLLFYHMNEKIKDIYQFNLVSSTPYSYSPLQTSTTGVLEVTSLLRAKIFTNILIISVQATPIHYDLVNNRMKIDCTTESSKTREKASLWKFFLWMAFLTESRKRIEIRLIHFYCLNIKTIMIFQFIVYF